MPRAISMHIPIIIASDKPCEGNKKLEGLIYVTIGITNYTSGYSSFGTLEDIMAALFALRKVLRSPLAMYGRTMAGRLLRVSKHTPIRRRMLKWSKSIIIADSAMNFSISFFSETTKGNVCL